MIERRATMNQVARRWIPCRDVRRIVLGDSTVKSEALPLSNVVDGYIRTADPAPEPASGDVDVALVEARHLRGTHRRAGVGKRNDSRDPGCDVAWVSPLYALGLLRGLPKRRSGSAVV